RRGQGIEGVRRRDDPRTDVDAIRAQTPRISLAIHTFVVLCGDQWHLAHVVWEHEMREEFAGLLGVRLHVCELRIVELPRLLEELVADRDLPIVMQER